MLSTYTIKGTNRRTIKFSEWVPFDNALEHATEEAGVYEIRMVGGMKFGRVKEESDIVYIGSTTNSFKSRFGGVYKTR